MTNIGFAFNFLSAKSAITKIIIETKLTEPIVAALWERKVSFKIVSVAAATNPTTAGRKPFNALLTNPRFLYLLYKNNKKDIIIADGVIKPIVATIAPPKPATCCPQVAALKHGWGRFGYNHKVGKLVYRNQAF